MVISLYIVALCALVIGTLATFVSLFERADLEAGVRPNTSSALGVAFYVVTVGCLVAIGLLP